MDLGPSRADEGRAWFGDTDIDGTHSLIGQVPILSGDGDVLAVASVSEAYPSVWDLLSGAGERLLIYLGLAAALGMVASWLLSRRSKKTHPQSGGGRDREPGRPPGSPAAQHS